MGGEVAGGEAVLRFGGDRAVMDIFGGLMHVILYK
jgi:hypothetical protein